jgi:hypothetical protein
VVECSVILPLFLLLVAGILEFARSVANRSQIEVALRSAGEYGATLQGDCLTPARDRFFATMAVLKSGSELTLTVAVVPFADGVQAIELVALGREPIVLGGLTIGVRVVGLFPLESRFGCTDPTTLTSTSAEYARERAL